VFTRGDTATAYRCRNRLPFTRTIHKSTFASKNFYESKYKKWSTTALYAGTTLPIRRHMDLGLYYDHQNNTGKKPNQQLNQIGLIANLYFSIDKR